MRATDREPTHLGWNGHQAAEPYFKSVIFNREIGLKELSYWEEIDLQSLYAEVVTALESATDRIRRECEIRGSAPRKLYDAKNYTLIIFNRIKSELKLRHSPVMTPEQKLQMERLELQKETLKQAKAKHREETDLKNRELACRKAEAKAAAHQKHQSALAAKEYQTRKVFWQLLCERFGEEAIQELADQSRKVVDEQGIVYVDVDK